MKYCIERKLRLDLSAHYNIDNLGGYTANGKQESFMPLLPITNTRSKLKQSITYNLNNKTTLHQLLQQKSQSISLNCSKPSTKQMLALKKRKGTVFKNLSMKFPINKSFHGYDNCTLFQKILNNKPEECENKPNYQKKKLLMLLNARPSRYTPKMLKLICKRESDVYNKMLSIKSFKAGNVLFDLDDDIYMSRNNKMPSALSEIIAPSRKNTCSCIKSEQPESSNMIISVIINKKQ